MQYTASSSGPHGLREVKCRKYLHLWQYHGGRIPWARNNGPDCAQWPKPDFGTEGAVLEGYDGNGSIRALKL